jgi:2-dehydropantoate 2-reductase
MKIAVAGGAGAMGSIFGGRLFQSGQDVLLYDIAENAVKNINDNGLRLLDKNGQTETIPVKASSNPADTENSDVVVIFTKCFHTETAVRSLKPHLNKRTQILSLQNGWGNAQTISNITGRDNLLIGVNYISGTQLEAGYVKQAGNPVAYIGRWGRQADDFTYKLSEIFTRAGIQTSACNDVVSEIWKKLALNVATLPTSALLRFQAHLLSMYEPMLQLMKALLRETIEVAHAQNIALDFEERISTIIDLLNNASGARSSMLQDAEAARKTEIDVINGAIVRAGAEFGIATPYNESMVLLIKSLEQNYLQNK